MSKHGDGSLYLDERTGLWRGTVDLGIGADGKRKRKYVSSRSKPVAARKLRDARERRNTGLRQLDERTTVGQWLEHWSANVLPRSVSAGTVRNYTDIVNFYLVPQLGKVKLARLQPAHVERMMTTLEEQGLSANTVRLARAILRRALTIAERQELVQRNAAALTDAPKQQKAKLSDALEADEAAAVLDAARGDRLEALAVLVLSIGLRQGEALTLRWSDVKLDTAGCNVRKAKTDAGVRTVPLPAFVVTALREHRARQREERIASDVWGDPDLVFTSTVGTVIDRRNCLRWWHGLTEGAGVGRRRFHASRHTAAMLMLNNGVPLEQVSSILGHAGLSITADIYAKPNTETLRSAVDVMADALGR